MSNFPAEIVYSLHFVSRMFAAADGGVSVTFTPHGTEGQSGTPYTVTMDNRLYAGAVRKLMSGNQPDPIIIDGCVARVKNMATEKGMNYVSRHFAGDY